MGRFFKVNYQSIMNLKLQRTLQYFECTSKHIIKTEMIAIITIIIRNTDNIIYNCDI